ncbi:hypothetical protein JOY44_23615 [Phormidium sp. CLA17]|uniref:hypothetical protein n=1 Tax=Leptolyngbya sp. Cla-17 TaxID=2803751 RepID=UPI0014917BDD|nr:hypothetical protein [Leptolyngbya sp. Cla-17]MBM0744559.1 hypothetical protein [Leptolyngbya sp. Cla-17]
MTNAYNPSSTFSLPPEEQPLGIRRPLLPTAPLGQAMLQPKFLTPLGAKPLTVLNPAVFLSRQQSAEPDWQSPFEADFFDPPETLRSPEAAPPQVQLQPSPNLISPAPLNKRGVELNEVFLNNEGEIGVNEVPLIEGDLGGSDSTSVMESETGISDAPMQRELVSREVSSIPSTLEQSSTIAAAIQPARIENPSQSAIQPAPETQSLTPDAPVHGDRIENLSQSDIQPASEQLSGSEALIQPERTESTSEPTVQLKADQSGADVSQPEPIRFITPQSDSINVSQSDSARATSSLQPEVSQSDVRVDAAIEPSSIAIPSPIQRSPESQSNSSASLQPDRIETTQTINQEAVIDSDRLNVHDLVEATQTTDQLAENQSDSTDLLQLDRVESATVTSAQSILNEQYDQPTLTDAPTKVDQVAPVPSPKVSQANAATQPKSIETTTQLVSQPPTNPLSNAALQRELIADVSSQPMTEKIETEPEISNAPVQQEQSNLISSISPVESQLTISDTPVQLDRLETLAQPTIETRSDITETSEIADTPVQPDRVEPPQSPVEHDSDITETSTIADDRIETPQSTIETRSDITETSVIADSLVQPDRVETPQLPVEHDSDITETSTIADDRIETPQLTIETRSDVAETSVIPDTPVQLDRLETSVIPDTPVQLDRLETSVIPDTPVQLDRLETSTIADTPVQLDRLEIPQPTVETHSDVAETSVIPDTPVQLDRIETSQPAIETYSDVTETSAIADSLVQPDRLETFAQPTIETHSDITETSVIADTPVQLDRLEPPQLPVEHDSDIAGVSTIADSLVQPDRVETSQPTIETRSDITETSAIADDRLETPQSTVEAHSDVTETSVIADTPVQLDRLETSVIADSLVQLDRIETSQPPVEHQLNVTETSAIADIPAQLDRLETFAQPTIETHSDVTETSAIADSLVQPDRIETSQPTIETRSDIADISTIADTPVQPERLETLAQSTIESRSNIAETSTIADTPVQLDRLEPPQTPVETRSDIANISTISDTRHPDRLATFAQPIIEHSGINDTQADAIEAENYLDNVDAPANAIESSASTAIQPKLEPAISEVSQRREKEGQSNPLPELPVVLQRLSVLEPLVQMQSLTPVPLSPVASHDQSTTPTDEPVITHSNWQTDWNEPQSLNQTGTIPGMSSDSPTEWSSIADLFQAEKTPRPTSAPSVSEWASIEELFQSSTESNPAPQLQTRVEPNDLFQSQSSQLDTAEGYADLNLYPITAGVDRIQREPDSSITLPATPLPATIETSEEPSASQQDIASPEQLERLAHEVYRLVRHRLALERERVGQFYSGRL